MTVERNENSFRSLLPHAETEYEAMVSQFAAKSTELTTEFIRLSSRDELLRTLQKLAVQGNWKRVASYHNPILDSVVGSINPDIATLWTDGGYDKKDMERCDASVTTCDCLVAQTGSMFLTAKSCGGRAISILPPHHVVVATKEQLLSDLPAAYKFMQEKYEGGFPSMMTLVTGPSRTGDIERILVLGAHGPKKLTIILIG